MSWKIPSLNRGGCTSNFSHVKFGKLAISPLPIKLQLECSNPASAEKRPGNVNEGHIGEVFKIVLHITSIVPETLKNLRPIIILAKTVTAKFDNPKSKHKSTKVEYELMNKKQFEIPLAGELESYIEALEGGKTYKKEIEVLFTEKNTYRIGALCNFPGTSTTYLCTQTLIFEIS